MWRVVVLAQLIARLGGGPLYHRFSQVIVSLNLMD